MRVPRFVDRRCHHIGTTRRLYGRTMMLYHDYHPQLDQSSIEDSVELHLSKAGRIVRNRQTMSTMKAVGVSAYGPVDNLESRDVPRPSNPTGHDILVLPSIC
jgi:hypothetical protein